VAKRSGKELGEGILILDSAPKSNDLC